MRVLVVDDNAEKVRRILNVFESVPGVTAEDVDVAYTARDARVRLTENAYDLMILDIALPEWADVPPAPEVGLALLKEVSERRKYIQPKHIVGLTAYPEALVLATPGFQQELWHIIQYDAKATDWIEQLQRKMKYLLLAATNKQASGRVRVRLVRHYCPASARGDSRIGSTLELEAN